MPNRIWKTNSGELKGCFARYTDSSCKPSFLEIPCFFKWNSNNLLATSPYFFAPWSVKIVPISMSLSDEFLLRLRCCSTFESLFSRTSTFDVESIFDSFEHTEGAVYNFWFSEIWRFYGTKTSPKWQKWPEFLIIMTPKRSE